MGNDEEKTTVSVHKSTVERLQKYGTIGDTMEDVILMLADFYDKKKK